MGWETLLWVLLAGTLVFAVWFGFIRSRPKAPPARDQRPNAKILRPTFGRKRRHTPPDGPA